MAWRGPENPRRAMTQTVISAGFPRCEVAFPRPSDGRPLSEGTIVTAKPPRSQPRDAAARSFPAFAALVPWRTWIHDRSLRTWQVILFLSLVTVPSAASVVFQSNPGDYHTFAWAFAVYFAGAWLLLLWVIIRPANLTWKMGAQVAVLALVLEAPLARSEE